MLPVPSHRRDLVLVRSALQGQGVARAELFRRFACVPAFLRSANGRLGRPLDGDAIDDIAQDVLLLLWRKLPDYRGHAALESWVFAFCWFELRNAARLVLRRQRWLVSLDAERSFDEPAVDVPVDLGLRSEEFERLLESLSAREAQVVRLRHVDGLDMQQIATVLGISRSSVSTFHARAMTKLRERLG